MSRIKDLLADVDLQAYYSPPPIPTDAYDWSVIDANTYEGSPLDPVGYGRTREEAIQDFVQILFDRYGE